MRRKGGRAGLPKKGKWSPPGMGTTVVTKKGKGEKRRKGDKREKRKREKKKEKG